MRIAIAVLLGIIALAAAGVWALGQFGSSLTDAPIQGEATVREPEQAAPAAAEPQDQAALRSAPAPAVTGQAAPAPVPAPPPPPPADEPQPADALSTEKAPAELQAEQAKPEAPAREAFASPAQAAPGEPSAAAEPEVAARSAPAAAPAATADVVGLQQQFKARRVTYNRPPQTLALNKPVDISLVINATDDADAGKEALQGFPGTIVDRDVDLSDFVSAELAGTDFDIELQTTSPRQKLSAKIPNQWRWRVRPAKTGEHTLTLTIYGYASGSLDAEPLDSYRDVIKVEVKQFDQVVSWARGVQPVFAVVAGLAGALSAVFAFLRFREEKKRSKRGAPTA